MKTLKEKIEEVLECLEVDGSPGSGGWIDVSSRREAVDLIEKLFLKEIEIYMNKTSSVEGSKANYYFGIINVDYQDGSEGEVTFKIPINE